MMAPKGLFIVVSAPSGAGKSSICQRLLALCPEMQFSVSYTSRPPRPNEVDGQDYHFISREAFQTRIAQGEFVEWVENFNHYYGTSLRQMNETLAQGADLLLDIEPRGAKTVKENFKDGVFVFVLPPSLEELGDRLKKRGHESDEAIQTRFSQAASEIKEVSWYDYSIFNDDLDTAVSQLRAIYLAEKCRTGRLAHKINRLLSSM
jgi:guanylate kinase